MVKKICTATEAVSEIKRGQTVASVGVIGWNVPDAVLGAIRSRFDETGSPSDLTFYFPVGVGDSVGIRGMDHVAVEGLMKRVISGSYINPTNPETGAKPELMRLIQNNLVEAYSWPIGASMHWLREVARKSPGYLTRVGLDTYIDPGFTGGKLTSLCPEDLVKRVEFQGEEFLFYPTWGIDYGIIRATSADEFGNLSFEEEAMVSSAIALAIAVKASGGKVIAQVKKIVPTGSRLATAVRIPSVLVDHVVEAPSQAMVTNVDFDATYLGQEHRPLSSLKKIPFGPAKIIARRAAMEVRRNELSIFGFGASSDVPLVMVEDGAITEQNIDEYMFTTEHGSFGGVVMNGWQFSCNVNPRAILDGLSQFDLIDGGLCSFAALAFAEFDERGVVNVSRFGKANPGAGGFIDIAQNARRLVFTGTFTTGGLDVSYDDVAGLKITKEGKATKFVNRARDVTYRVMEGVAHRGQSAMLITERAVFSIAEDGLVLEEIAPGVDVNRDVLEKMEFPPVRISDPLVTMDRSLFKP